jgi:hypothetical protein
MVTLFTRNVICLFFLVGIGNTDAEETEERMGGEVAVGGGGAGTTDTDTAERARVGRGKVLSGMGRSLRV